MLGLAILASLLDSLDSFVIAVSNSSGGEKLKFDDVVGILLTEDTRRKSSSFSEGSGGALNVEAHGRSLNRDNRHGKDHAQSKSGYEKNITCFNCGEKGHIARACPTLKKKEEKHNEGKDLVGFFSDDEG